MPIQYSNYLPVAETFKGMFSPLYKVFASDGSDAFYCANSKGDLDTDGCDPSNLVDVWDTYHQSKVTSDVEGSWFSSYEVPSMVMPLGFDKRHGGVGIGTLGTMLYGGNHVHFVIGDYGPSLKIGEFSIKVFTSLGIQKIINRKIEDTGFDNGVQWLWYIGHKMPMQPGSETQLIRCTANDINRLAAPLFESFAKYN